MKEPIVESKRNVGCLACAGCLGCAICGGGSVVLGTAGLSAANFIG